LDTDQDGLLNFLDSDDDGDGLETSLENPDSNNDGSDIDSFDADNDGIKDYLDPNNYSTGIDPSKELEVYNALSPNGDGYNDVFTIRNIELYPENELTIFNRWGKEIYKTEAYGQYDRYFKGYGPSGKTVPVGTYFYILKVKINGSDKVYKGYLYINR
jgi:gliding motility-associated-like protein